MRFQLFLIVAIAVAVVPLAQAQANKKGREPVGGITQCLSTIVKNKNFASLLPSVVSFFNDAGLTKYVVNNATLNWALINQDMVFLLPLVSDWLNANLVPIYPKLGITINATLAVIDNLKNDAVSQTKLGVHLLSINYDRNSAFVSSTTASPAELTVAFDSYPAAANAAASNDLNRYVVLMVKRSIQKDKNYKNFKYGPIGNFNQNEIWVKF